MTAKDSRLDRHFERRSKAALAGLHLPSEVELLRGMPFLGDDIRSDIHEYGERLARRVKRLRRLEFAPLAASLDDLAIEQNDEAVQVVEAALAEAAAFNVMWTHAAQLRCQVYLAFYGHPQAAAAIAGETAAMALRDMRDHGDFRLVSRALAWAKVANSYALMHRNGPVLWSPSKVDRDVCAYAEKFETAIRQQEPDEKLKDKEPPAAKKWNDFLDEPVERARGTDGAVVVFRSIGNDTTSEGKRVVNEFETLLDVALPLPVTPELAPVRAKLAVEFPYAIAVIDDILKRLVGRKHIHVRPTILVGTPGCGKTRLARRLYEELAIPYELVPCGGLSDSALGGTARRWSSGEPSLAVMAIRRHRNAGPIIVLDEIEKIGTSRHNGNFHDVLIGQFEKETSSRWFDPYVESACDLSHVSWVMTANTVATIPPVLRDRCRILAFPEPGPEHLAVLAPRILERVYADSGHDPRWATPFDATELAVLAANWPGGSIRQLERLIETVVEARGRHQPRQ
ncbi:AAA family ATPase [Mesorhizobium sp. INR15]|uniref:AAA family ATPase n=1 Tax=Mesorhizobium sp. INR15 TaxID=2654248 RepID=UPI0018968D17|nr:AAA family ATPase [Mesorhizobium sp. INR15]QPC91610.1 AAA family ATPase [Mesorhizobium sp. INR15]